MQKVLLIIENYLMFYFRVSHYEATCPILIRLCLMCLPSGNRTFATAVSGTIVCKRYFVSWRCVLGVSVDGRCLVHRGTIILGEIYKIFCKPNAKAPVSENFTNRANLLAEIYRLEYAEIEQTAEEKRRGTRQREQRVFSAVLQPAQRNSVAYLRTAVFRLGGGEVRLHAQRFDVDIVFLEFAVQGASAKSQFARDFTDIAFVHIDGGANEVFLGLRCSDHRRFPGLKKYAG